MQVCGTVSHVFPTLLLSKQTRTEKKVLSMKRNWFDKKLSTSPPRHVHGIVCTGLLSWSESVEKTWTPSSRRDLKRNNCGVYFLITLVGGKRLRAEVQKSIDFQLISTMISFYDLRWFTWKGIPTYQAIEGMSKGHIILLRNYTHTHTAIFFSTSMLHSRSTHLVLDIKFGYLYSCTSKL